MRFLFILLFSVTLFAGEWTITDFTIRGKQFTQSATGILQGNLNRIPSYKAPKGDELLLRRRLDMNNYGLYIGKAEASAYANLSRFTKPAGMSMDKLLKMKFFKDKTPTGYNDVADIYFQGEYIYVKNLVRIFYKDGGNWKSLEVKQGAKPGVLEISSTPNGATVTIDGVVKGKTPYTFVMDAPTVEVEVSKSGYYSQSFTANAAAGEVKTVSPIMKQKVTFSSSIKPKEMLDTTIQDIEQAIELLSSIKTTFGKEKRREAIALAEFEKSFPKLKPQGEFEYDHEFAKRKTEYDSKKQSALAAVTVDSAAFSSVITTMSKHIDLLTVQLYDLYLPVNSMKLGRYEINEGRFPVTLSVNQGAFRFNFKGYLLMDRDAAKAFKFSSDEKGLKLQYSKRKVTVSGKEYYTLFGEFNIPFQNKVYELRGNIFLPSNLASNSDVKRQQQWWKNEYFKIVAEKRDREEREAAQREIARIAREKAEQERLAKENAARELAAKRERNRQLLYRGTVFKAMKKIPGGKFKMGTSAKNNSARPPHKVELSSFWMDSTEVTVKEFTRLMGGKKLKRLKEQFNNVPGNEHPITLVSWYDAILYCNERSKEAGLDTVYSYRINHANKNSYAKDTITNVFTNFNRNGYRLPTEAEWEYAFGEYKSYDPYTYAVCGTNGQRGTRSKYGQGSFASYYGVRTVASKSPNNFGLYDMAGNVREWCNDLYGAKYYNVSPKVNPRGPSVSNSTSKIIRGGAWNSQTGKQQVRASGYSYNVETSRFTRSFLPPSSTTGRNYWGSSSSKDGKFLNIGFRCVLPIKESN